MIASTNARNIKRHKKGERRIFKDMRALREHDAGNANTGNEHQDWVVEKKGK